MSVSASADFKQYLTKQVCSVTNFLIYKPEYAMEVWGKISLSDISFAPIIFDVYDFMIALLCQKNLSYFSDFTGREYIKHPVTNQNIPTDEMEKVWGFFGTTARKVQGLWSCTYERSRIQMFANDLQSHNSKKWKVFREHTNVPLLEKSRCTIL